MIRPRLNGLCALRDLYLLLNSTCVLRGLHYNGEMWPLILVRRLNVDRFQSFGESKFIKMCLASLKRNISLSGEFLVAAAWKPTHCQTGERKARAAMGPDVTDNQLSGPFFANWKGRQKFAMGPRQAEGREKERGKKKEGRRGRLNIAW